MKKILLLVFLLAVLSNTGCYSAQRARIFATASPHKIEVFSGGQVVRTYHSAGRVLTEEHSDGWYFEDSTTGKLVHVAGTVVITQE